MPKQIKNEQSGNKANRLIASYHNPNFALLAEIHAEIAPKKSVEILPEITGPEWRTRGANKRSTDTAGKGEFVHIYTVGTADADADLSFANSQLCETPRGEFEAKGGGEAEA